MPDFAWILRMALRDFRKKHLSFAPLCQFHRGWYSRFGSYQ